jgi:hypothetical protein
MALAVIPRDASVDSDDNVVPAVPRPPQHWTICDDLIWEVATWAGDPATVCNLATANWRFREAVDDSVWRLLCHFGPRLQAPPRPFGSFQQYYRACVMQHPEAGSDRDGARGPFGPLVRGVRTRGNIVERERAASFGDVFFPIVQVVHERAKCDLLLLDRAEHVFVGLAASSAATTSRVLETRGTHSLFVVPYCIPGTCLTLAREIQEGVMPDGSDGLVFTATRQIQCDDEPREAIAVRQVLPLDAVNWNYAFGLGAHGASCAAL